MIKCISGRQQSFFAPSVCSLEVKSIVRLSFGSSFEVFRACSMIMSQISTPPPPLRLGS